MKSLGITFIFIFLLSNLANSQTQTGLNVGDKAPRIQTLADDGQNWDSNNYLGKKNIVVYFYPAAMTGGCTKQACAYRDFKNNLESENTIVVGVSGDNVEGLKLFKNAYDLNFTLLSDEKGKIATEFGVPQRDGGKIEREIEGKQYELIRGTTTSRWTFIIGKNGKVIYKNDQVNATEDTKEVLDFLKNI